MQAQATAIEKPGPCIARQPILSADEDVFSYELLFRTGPTQEHFNSDGESATGTTIDTVNVIGLNVLCDGHLAFINCTHQMLLKEYFSLLPPNEVVVEIQESVPPEEEVVAACLRLKQRGYAIALDNFAPGDPRENLVPYADFIKIDVKHLPLKQAANLVAHLGTSRRRMLAHKVETRELFLAAKKSGFTAFQGYFFRHPEQMRVRQIPSAAHTTYLLLMQAVSQPQTNFAEIENLIKHEPSLCYRLLRYLNSPLLGISLHVVSVRHALSLLGEREFIRWIRMATTLAMGQGKPSDLVLSSLVRARFCELISPKLTHGESDLFLMGMLSVMDAILELPRSCDRETLPRCRYQGSASLWQDRRHNAALSCL